MLTERDKIITDQKNRINDLENEHQLKYNEGTLFGLESGLGVLEKYHDLDVSSIQAEIEESKT